MALLWTDGTWTSAYAIGKPVFSSPIPNTTTAYVLRQPFMQFGANWAPLALNTAHPDYSAFKLVEESEREDVGGDVVKWTRTYAKPPAAWNDYADYTYNFIGFAGSFGVNVETATGRERWTEIVSAKISFDYWIANKTTQIDPITKLAHYIASAADIPRIPETLYYEAGYTNLYTDYLKDSPPYATATVPSVTEYEALITADAADADSFSIVAERSAIARWMGEIWERKTIYIKAK